MSTFRRRMMQQASEHIALPEGCTRLNCLVSTGTQWIDAEHICQADEDIFIDAYLLTPQNGKVNNVMGWRWSGNYTSKTHCIITQDGRDSTYNDTPYVGIGASMRATDYADFWTTQAIGNTPNRFQVEISPNKKQVLVNGNVWNGVAGWTDQYGSNYTNYLFALNDIGNIDESRLANMRLYEYWIKDADGNFIQHLIPILDTNGVACLYDDVKGKFHYNKGKGSFAYFREEPYLRNSSKTYINTNVVASNSTNLEICYGAVTEFKDKGQYPFIFGDGDTFRLGYSSYSVATPFMRIQRGIDADIVLNNPNYNDNNIVKFTPTQILLNEEIIDENSNGYTINGKKTICLFMNNNNAFTHAECVIYYCKIYDDDTLVRDFVPHYQDGKWGMLDKVENKFYTSPNGGLFDGYIPNE